uniref:Ubiquitin carboxyl-terminal hydrolase MINDY n=1 Tax=Stegastes partitus TaxID=144197 RepID=A0A3B5B5R6_9TELE
IMVASVEEVSSSLVREYLSRKGLKRTIACMDEEHPRTEASINNRSQLRQILNIEDLYTRNKASLTAGHHIERLKKDKTTSSENDSSQPISSIADPPAGTKSVMNDVKTEEIAPAFVISKQSKLRYFTDYILMHYSEAAAEHSHAGRPMDERVAAVGDLRRRFCRQLPRSTLISLPVSVCLQELKAVLLGSSLSYFNAEWRSQGFTFSETHDLRYGIVQKKGGPCGVLASVQAFVLKKLLFENPESGNAGLQPSNATRRKCLVLAAAEVLWRAGEEKRATVAINSGRNHFTPTGRYKSDGVLEKVKRSLFNTFLNESCSVKRFEAVSGTTVLFLSVLRVREDMDVPTTTLIGAHGYCTQELVNLLLCGRAVSNVFDNDMELDSGDGNATLLKGIKGSCDVGLLSLFEHYNICKVGAHLKTPCFPIWVVCSESHFSVLFGLQRELLTNEDRAPDFDLYYYDGLANQQEEIRLTVCT